MSEAASYHWREEPRLESANFHGEVCKDASKYLRRAMSHDDAYVINGMLVLKLSRAEEAFHLGMPNIQISDTRSYGMRVGLCVKDAPPFKRGEWYALRGEMTRRHILQDTEDRTRTPMVPMIYSDWKSITHIDEINKSPELLEEATHYAERMQKGN